MSLSEKPVPVVHFVTELSIGGAQTALLRLLAGMDRDRFSPTVVCLYNGDASVAQQIRGQGTPVIDLGMAGWWRWDAFGRLFRLLRRDRPTILHTWMFHANLPGRVLGWLAGVPIVVSSERTMGQESRWRYWLNRSTAPLADRVICVSGKVADFASETIGLAREKLVVIPNGIDPHDYDNSISSEQSRSVYKLPPQAVIIGAIGRPRPVKGFHFLLEAIAHICPTHPDAHLLFVGNGPDRPALVARTSQLGLDSVVTFLGDQPDIPNLLPALDMLALPSLFEGMSNVALEAMAAGLPVVATAVGGTPEVVHDGVTGLLVPPGDSETLAKAIETVLADPDRARAMGRAGRQRVIDHFDIRTTVRRTEALYEELLQEKLGSSLRASQEPPA